MADEARRFEADAAATRDRIAATIDDLQARLSPKALVDGAVVAVGDAGRHALTSVRGAAAGHPLALAAAGLTVGIGLLARSRIARAKVDYGDGYAAYADFDDGYAAKLAADVPAPGKARVKLSALQQQAHVAVDDRPLSVVGVGVATGALLGAVVPLSPPEASLLGDLHRRLAAAGDAAIAAAKDELSPAKLSLRGGMTGVSDRLTASLVAVLAAAGTAFVRPLRSGSDA